MLTENMVPNGVLSARPPAKGFEASPVWQGAQSAARARYSPRATRAASSCGSLRFGARDEPQCGEHGRRAGSHSSQSVPHHHLPWQPPDHVGARRLTAAIAFIRAGLALRNRLSAPEPRNAQASTRPRSEYDR